MSLLVAQVETFDHNTPRTRKRMAGSLPANIEILERGEAHIHSQQVSGIVLGSQEAYEYLQTTRRELQNRVSVAVKRAKAANPGREYTTETQDMITSKGRFFLTVIIIRIDSEEDEL